MTFFYFVGGDVKSAQLRYECFEQFSLAFEMVVNKNKSSILFGGVPLNVQASIIDLLGFSKGDLLVRYLGVPLCTRRLTTMHFQPLLNRILGRVTSWTTKLLSYVGRL